MSSLQFKFISKLVLLSICLRIHSTKHLTPIELENLEAKTVLVKLDLVNITEFVTQEVVSVIFYYRTLLEVPWIVWLEKSLPIIYPTPIGIVHCDSDQNYFSRKNCIDLGFKPPSIRIYRYGYTHSEYKGEKNAWNFANYIKKVTPNSLRRLDNLESFKRFLDETQQTSVIGFFKNETDLEEVFIQVAKELRGVIFGYSSDNQVLNFIKLKNNIVLFHPKHLNNNYENNFIIYDDKPDFNTLKNFIINNQNSLVGIRTYFNMKNFPKPQIITYFDLSNKELFTSFRNLILPIANEFKNITFAVSDKQDFTEDLIEFGVEKPRVFYSKILVLAQTQENYKYILDEFKTEGHLRAFADGFVNKMLSQFVKSQDLKHSKPHSESSPINLAVGRNFLQLVNKNSKDLLVLLFNFDCFESLISMDFTAKEFREEMDKVGFIAMNVHLNDVPRPFYFDECPTIFFAGRGFKNNPVLYEGSPDCKKLRRFMREQRALHESKRKR